MVLDVIFISLKIDHWILALMLALFVDHFKLLVHCKRTYDLLGGYIVHHFWDITSIIFHVIVYIYIYIYIYIYRHYESTPDYIPIHHVIHVEYGNKALLLLITPSLVSVSSMMYSSTSLTSYS